MKKTRQWLKKAFYNFLAILLGLIVAFILVEIILRIFQPFPFRVKGNKIVLAANQQFHMTNPHISKLDSTIIHTKNSLGFRGQEPPENLDDYLSIITIGGSTTECYFISDDSTWQERLRQKLNQDFDNIWINNAGLEGHSTFGHQVLLQDYVIKLNPKIVLFLVGINDVATTGFDDFDKLSMQQLDYNSVGGFIKSLTHYSETLGLAFNFYRYYLAYQQGLTHQEIDFKNEPTAKVPLEKQQAILIRHQQTFLPAYEKRLIGLAQTCKNNGIAPMFVTQPQIIGDTIDPITKVNLGTMAYQNINGQLGWQIMELYNDITRKVCSQNDLVVIDLAREMPKNTHYFYDHTHYTNEGTAIVAEILYQNLKEPLKKFDKMNLNKYFKIK